MKINHLLLLFFGILFLASSCEKKNDDDPSLCEVQIGEDARFFKFQHSKGHTFIAWTNKASVIDQILIQLALPVEFRDQHINGKILRIPDGCNLNDGWSWYFDPEDWAMADLSIELCDGDPQFVEENLDEYVRTGRYCPWGSIVLEEINRPF